MAARPPRPRFHSAEVSPEFVVWSENPADNWLLLPCFLIDELTGRWSRRALVAGGWLLQQGLLGRSRDFRRGQHSPGLRLADVRPRARLGQAMHPPLQV